MKRTKKLLALVLAMMMAFTTLVLPAAAHGSEDEGVMPLSLQRPCTEPYCSGTVTSRTETRYTRTEFRNGCDKCSYSHYHKVPYSVDIEECNSCPYFAELRFYGSQAPDICLHNQH